MNKINRKRFFRYFALLALTLVSAIALARTYGPYQCDTCLLGGPSPDGDTQTFISTVVNHDVSYWAQGDTLVICNQTTCATYSRGMTGFVRIATVPNTGGGGGGAGGDPGTGSTGGSGGGGTYSCGYVSVGGGDPMVFCVWD